MPISFFGTVTSNVSEGWVGRTITINNTGSGFYDTMTVKFGGAGGTDAEKIEIDTSYGNGQQRMTCRIPFLSTGTYELYISNPDEENTTISDFEIIKNFTWNVMMP